MCFVKGRNWHAFLSQTLQQQFCRRTLSGIDPTDLIDDFAQCNFLVVQKIRLRVYFGREDTFVCSKSNSLTFDIGLNAFNDFCFGRAHIVFCVLTVFDPYGPPNAPTLFKKMGKLFSVLHVEIFIQILYNTFR